MAKKTSPVNKTIKKTEKPKTKARLSPELKSLLERADQARYEFRNKEAIDLYTLAIDSGQLDAAKEFDAPHITGITALVRAKHPELTPFQIKTVLLACAANTKRQGK